MKEHWWRNFVQSPHWNAGVADVDEFIYRAKEWFSKTWVARELPGLWDGRANAIAYQARFASRYDKVVDK